MARRRAREGAGYRARLGALELRALLLDERNWVRGSERALASLSRPWWVSVKWMKKEKEKEVEAQDRKKKVEDKMLTKRESLSRMTAAS